MCNILETRMVAFGIPTKGRHQRQTPMTDTKDRHQRHTPKTHTKGTLTLRHIPKTDTKHKEGKEGNSNNSILVDYDMNALPWGLHLVGYDAFLDFMTRIQVMLSPNIVSR